jgi:PIN domain nuclease of toxin-antitoxin system
VAVVLDASALLAFWLGEDGGTVVQEAIESEGALVASVNFAEVVAKMDDLQPGFATRLPDVPPRVASEATIAPSGSVLRGGVLLVDAIDVVVRMIR